MTQQRMDHHDRTSTRTTHAKNDDDTVADRFLQTIRENQRVLMQYNPDDLDMNANNFTVMDALHRDIADRFLKMRETFVRQGFPCTVDIGYHYTKRSYLSCIQSHGLLTLADRQKHGLPDVSNGRSFGDGVYTSHNPYSYHGFAGGDVGLFVARLQGTTRRFEETGFASTVLGRAGNTDEVCVLQESAQCFPLVLFPVALVESDNDESVGNAMVHTYHARLQSIMDDFFQQSVPTLRWVPSLVVRRQTAATTTPPTAVFYYKAPEQVLHCPTTQSFRPAKHPDETRDACSICWNPMNGNDAVALHACGHAFHQQCITTCLSTMYSCPMCRACVGVPQGRSPSGSMTVALQQNVHCLGYSGSGTIVIQYDMPNGIQAPYHENPGVPFVGVQRTAYLPNTQEGRDVLKRLKFAFCNGLVFCVGTSMTTGLSNRITWASIHHKTTVHCGAYGYPDPSYFGNVNAELDRLHVPPASDL